MLAIIERGPLEASYGKKHALLVLIERPQDIVVRSILLQSCLAQGVR
jgi:hypothetical protein